MSIKTLTPLLTNTLSLGFCSSSRPIWYCRPEQPPPTTRMRRAYFSCISAGVSSRILEAAASVMVIILSSCVLRCAKRLTRRKLFMLPGVRGTASMRNHTRVMYHTGWGNSNWQDARAECSEKFTRIGYNAVGAHHALALLYDLPQDKTAFFLDILA